MKHDKEIDYAESKDKFVCELSACDYNYQIPHHSGTFKEPKCKLECQSECPYYALFMQVRERKELNEVHVPNVMSALLDAEIKYIKSDDFYTVPHGKMVALMTIERIRERIISYQEIK